MMFNSSQKDVLYSILQECSVDYAKENEDDEKEEDVILINNFLENVSRFEIVDKLVDKLNEKGFKITKIKE